MTLDSLSNVPMTPDQIGAIVNVAGYAVPLAISQSIARTYSRPYFRSWTLSYLGYAAAILVLNFGATHASFPWLIALAVILYQAGTWFILKTSEAIHPDEPRRQGRYRVWWAASVGALAILLAGQPLAMAMVGPVLLVVAGHLMLAGALLRVPFPPGRHGHQWLAAFVSVTGLWVLAFPLLDKTPWMWLGYVVMGALHLLMGIQMVIFLLEDVAWQQQRQYEALQQLDRLKSDFLSTVSHELRTPLTSIKSAAWLLDHPRAIASPSELKGMIMEQVDVLSRIVSDLLDISLIESGAMAYHKDTVNLVEVAKQAVGSQRLLYEKKGLDLQLEAPRHALEVTADGDRLKQVVANLLTNALKFTPEGGRVTVRVVAGDRPRLEVTDTGIGIAPDQRDRIFERFYQVDNTSTRKVGGTGLGLAIVKAIVEEGHHGRIWVESGPQGGSTFVVILPASAAVRRVAVG
jgi:signal transduction histidine kinase